MTDRDDLKSIFEPFWRTDDGLTAARRAEAFGIDLSMLDDNLLLTREQRLDQNQAALDLASALIAARSTHGKPQGSSL